LLGVRRIQLPIMASQSQQHMQCMEVWGGNRAFDNTVAFAGLDAWVYSKPYGGAEGGGGDVYYVSSCATGRIARLLLADVSGHGQAVQTMAVDLRELMRRFVNHLDHTQFIRLMNQQFVTMAKAGNFATAVVSTFFAPTARLTICNAGHPVPMLYRAASGKWSFLESREAPASDEPENLPLGILDLSGYSTFDVTLRTGDLVLCYTDALVESRSADGELLGQEGLMQIVQSMAVGEPRAFIEQVLDAIEAKSAGNLSKDDVSVLLFRPNGEGLSSSFLRGMWAAGKIMQEMGRSVIRRGGPVPWPDFKIANIGGAVLPPLQRMWKGKGKNNDEF
jgi:hypothetical protein